MKIIIYSVIVILFASCVETGYKICPIWNTRNTSGSHKKKQRLKISKRYDLIIQ